jgi:hypothetical protein
LTQRTCGKEELGRRGNDVDVDGDDATVVVVVINIAITTFVVLAPITASFVVSRGVVAGDRSILR